MFAVVICEGPLHDIDDHRFGQRLAAAGLPDEEERDPQLHADGHLLKVVQLNLTPK